MTGLIIPYQAGKDPYMGLTNWSMEFPFRIQDVKYPSVNHFIFCKMTNDRDNAKLLSTKNDNDLRERFNRLSDDLYFEYTQKIILDGAHMQFLYNQQFRTYFLQHPNHFFYYINENVLWGINSNGYGYNLIGQAFSRLTEKSHSSFYILTNTIIYGIYKANVLLVHHLQQGHDILTFIGNAIDTIVSTLSPIYPNLNFLDATLVERNYHENPFFQNIQFEIDYPWNLAGFVRKQYANQINYYLRNRFNDLMISKYFEYVLKKRFTKEIDVSQIDYYVQQQKARLTDEKFQQMSDILFRLYNDPATNQKTLAFLDSSDLNILYEIEIQFLNHHEIKMANKYVPFLYKVKHERSIYIYDQIDMNHIEPSITSISPISNLPFVSDKMSFENLLEYIYVKFTNRLTQMSLEKCHSMFLSSNYNEFPSILENSIKTYKLLLMKRGMTHKFQFNLFARYLLYNSSIFGFNIQSLDPDPIFQHNTPKILFDIRQTLSNAYFPVSLSLVGNHVHLQDRIRFRMEEFYSILDAYRIFKNIRKIDDNDFQILQKYIFRDPKTPQVHRTINPEFHEYYREICTENVISTLWNTFLTFSSLISSKELNQSEVHIKENPPQIKCVCSIIAYFIKVFYQGKDDLKFIDFVIQTLLGREIAFQSSISYYNDQMNDRLRQYLDIDNYPPQFIINIMGVVSIIENKISFIRLRFFSLLGLPTRSPPYPSSLSKKLSATAIIGRIVEEEESRKRGRGRRKQVEEKLADIQEDEIPEDDEQEEVDIAEMMQDLGLDDEEDEDQMNDQDSDLITEYE